MNEIIGREEIERILPRVDLLDIMEQGFVAYSRGEVTVPPPGELVSWSWTVWPRARAGERCFKRFKPGPSAGMACWNSVRYLRVDSPVGGMTTRLR